MTTPPKQPSAATVEQEVPVEIWNIIEECVQDLNAICTGNGRQVRLTPYFQRAITSATANLRRELEEERRVKAAGAQSAVEEFSRLEAEVSRLRTALGAVMGDIDWTKHACRLMDPIGTILSKEALNLAHTALADRTASPDEGAGKGT